jgi:hypothetical protein
MAVSAVNNSNTLNSVDKTQENKSSKPASDSLAGGKDAVSSSNSAKNANVVDNDNTDKVEISRDAQNKYKAIKNDNKKMIADNNKTDKDKIKDVSNEKTLVSSVKNTFNNIREGITALF